MNTTIVYLLLTLWNGGHPGDGVFNWTRTYDTMLDCQIQKPIETAKMVARYPDMPWYSECHTMIHTFLPPRPRRTTPDLQV